MNVIWYNESFGNFDHGLLRSIFDKNPEVFIQHNTKENPQFERAIVIVSGKQEVAPLRKYLDTLKSGLVILVSEEDAFFDWKTAIPPQFEIWTSYYSPSTKSEIKTRILLGAPGRIKDYKINTYLPKRYLWSFVGQCQNTFRQQCIEVLKTLPFGYLKVISGFGGYTEDGMEYQSYLDVMCQSEFVVAPSGSMNTDSFRVYESMLCRAIPITNKRCPRDENNFNYWNEVYPKHNFLTVENWNELPEMMERYAAEDVDSRNHWWKIYCDELEQKLIQIANEK